jgi:AcrR family transcriptional regulator
VEQDAIPDSQESPTLARILESARACFLRDGVRRTRISDIADGAGMVRQTVYDWVSSRDQLVDLAMAQRSRELGEQIRSRTLRRGLSIGEQIVDVVAAMAELAGSDPEFELLARAMPEEHAFAFLAGPSELTDVLELVLEPYFAGAREEGGLREALGARALAEWVQLVLATLRNRTDLGTNEVREQLRYFLLPALLKGKDF